MGKITELSQGSLNGLRRQLNECIENAYNKGYADGKNEPREVKAVNVEDTSEYQIGYKVGYAEALKLDEGTPTKDYTSGYNTALKDFENLLVYEHDYEQFFEDTYGSKDPDYNLYDLVAKYGAKKVLNDFKKWQEQKKQDEEEIKVGDIVVWEDGRKDFPFIVTQIKHQTYSVMNNEGGSSYFSCNAKLKKIGNASDKLQTLIDKLKGDN